MFKIGEMVYDRAAEHHILLDSTHPIFNGADYSSMLYYHNNYTHWVPSKNEVIFVWNNDTQMRKQIVGYFIELTRTMKYKVMSPEKKQFFKYASKFKGN